MRYYCKARSGAISIHALFAEGDGDLSTDQLLISISIHALFAEGDPDLPQCLLPSP